MQNPKSESKKYKYHYRRFKHAKNPVVHPRGSLDLPGLILASFILHDIVNNKGANLKEAALLVAEELIPLPKVSES